MNVRSWCVADPLDRLSVRLDVTVGHDDVQLAVERMPLPVRRQVLQILGVVTSGVEVEEGDPSLGVQVPAPWRFVSTRSRR